MELRWRSLKRRHGIFRPPYEHPFDNTGTMASAAIIFAFLVVGLIGNGLTIAVIQSYKALRTNIFMRFILSLCVSDLVSALISWLFLYRRTWGFDEWSPIPDLFCKFYWSADLMTSFVTALHIFSFAALRLISIRFPHKFNKITGLQEKIWICLIWMICFFCGFLPSWFIYGVGNPVRNSDDANARWPVCTVLFERMNEYYTFQKVAYTLFLYTPTIGIAIICSIIIALVKKKSRKVSLSKKCEKRRSKEKQAIVQLVLIIFAFLLGYIPFTAYEFWSIQDHPNDRHHRATDYWFGMIEYFFLRFSECLNPLFYNLGSSKMRMHTMMFLNRNVFCSSKLKNKYDSSRSRSSQSIIF